MVITLKRVRMLLCLCVLGCIFGTSTEATGVPCQGYTIMSMNCYAFDALVAKILKQLMHVDLMNRTSIGVSQRIAGIANFVRQLDKKPDVILFQELWLNDNKENMVKGLADLYPYYYYVPKTAQDYLVDLYHSVTGFIKLVLGAMLSSSALEGLNPIKMESGLLVMSRYPILDKTEYVYPIVGDPNAGGDRQAHKGALLVRIQKSGVTPLCLVNTQLDATGYNMSIRSDQMALLGSVVKTFVKSGDILILAGDLNEPVQYDQQSNRIVDKTRAITDAFSATCGVPMHNPIPTFLAQNKNTTSVLIIDNKHNQAFVSYPPLFDVVVPQSGVPSYTAAYFTESTDADGGQILDHMLLPGNVKLQSWMNYRGCILGDQGGAKPFDSIKALSDHSPIIFTVSLTN